MKLAGTSALVTGAAGTVGSVVAARLAGERMRVRAMVHRSAASFGPGIETVEADLCDPKALATAAAGAQFVVHCAATLTHDAERCRAINVDGTRNLLRALIEARTQLLVHISSCSVYDFQLGREFDEESPIWSEPRDPYGYSKAEAERLVRAAREEGLASVILRPMVVLSTHRNSYWGPHALERAHNSDAPLFPAAEMPYVHVDNLAEAVVLAAQRATHEHWTYNVIDGSAPTEQYLAAVHEALGRSAPMTAAGALVARFSGERIRRELGYAPTDRWREFLDQLSALRRDRL
jgi:nucleoside-diphosphate-sugar epimerase